MARFVFNIWWIFLIYLGTTVDGQGTRNRISQRRKLFPFVAGDRSVPRANFFPDNQQLRPGSKRNENVLTFDDEFYQVTQTPESLERLNFLDSRPSILVNIADPEDIQFQTKPLSGLSIRNQKEKEAEIPRQDSRLPRQRTAVPEEAGGLDIGTIASAGERCIDKVVMVEETEYDDIVECRHSYSQRCHTTYTTDFEPQQEEECEENFLKNCFIEYKKVSAEEKVQFCHTPLICDGEGPIECKQVFETECQTRFHEHKVEDDVVDCETVQEEKCESVTQGYTTEQKCTKWPREVCKQSKQLVSKFSPETECKKVPREICGPSGCSLKPGPEECFDKTETIIQEVPEENCNLEPQRACKQVTKLVPLLKPSEECLDIPKEVCSRSKTNPRKVQKPIVKKWCYVPTKESGLA